MFFLCHLGTASTNIERNVSRFCIVFLFLTKIRVLEVILVKYTNVLHNFQIDFTYISSFYIYLKAIIPWLIGTEYRPCCNTNTRAFQTLGRDFDFLLKLQMLGRVFEKLGRVFIYLFIYLFSFNSLF